jgi:branched-chain amino acid transport system ATP-binding protein
MLNVKNISTSYDGIEALRDVSLEISEGEMVALIGPNGAGKSTLLNCLSGIVPAAKGLIEFCDERISGLRPYSISRRGLLHVPEGRQILGDMSVEENLLLGELAKGSRISKYGLAEVYSMFPILAERRGLRADSLSGGQQQMLAIGRALMGGPRLLLLDEPSLGLAPIIVDQVYTALQSLATEGLTIFLVEQNAHRALRATKRAYVLESGRMAFDGLSADLVKDSRVVEHYMGKEPSITSTSVAR